MSYDLVGFHFNPVKTGQILKQFRLDKGMSISSVAKRTGLTYDTIDNIERGRVLDIKFETLFKLCCAYETSVEAVMLLMLTDMPISFRELIMLYSPKDDKILPLSSIDSTPGVVPDTAVAAAEAVAAAAAPPDPIRKSAENPDHIAALLRHIDHLTRLLELAITKGASA